jgi:hypothetical protein
MSVRCEISTNALSACTSWLSEPSSSTFAPISGSRTSG